MSLCIIVIKKLLLQIARKLICQHLSMDSVESMIYQFPGVHIYEGMALSRYIPAHKIDAAKVYEFHEDDIIVASYPKSGKT